MSQDTQRGAAVPSSAPSVAKPRLYFENPDFVPVGESGVAHVEVPGDTTGYTYNFGFRDVYGAENSVVKVLGHAQEDPTFYFKPDHSGDFTVYVDIIPPGHTLDDGDYQTLEVPVKATDEWAKHAWNNPRKRDIFILKQLVSKDFKLKYRRSVLGVLWSVLNPLLMMIVMSIVFTSFMRVGSETVKCFPLYLIIGNTVFTLMSDSTNQGMASIISAAPLLKKVKINRYVFPIEKVLFATVNFAFSMIAVVIVMLWFQIAPTLTLIMFPVALVYLMVFCAGLSLALSALSVFFRDVMHLWGVIITAWTYLTPLFYVITALPETLQHVMKFNPMYQYVTIFRDIILNGTWPTPTQHLICAACALVSLGIGILIFHKNEHKFILYI